jgi:general secretion pathway protein A
MYKSYYGIKEKPFQMTPDPAYLFMSRGHTDTYTYLEYALKKDRGLVVVTGETGSGKTSLINLLIGGVGARFTFGVMNPNIAHPDGFMATICHQFGLDVTGLDRAAIPGAFRDFLIRQQRTGNRTILIVDEAQDLKDTTIEEIRMLANLKTQTRYLVQIFLVGRPELRKKLEQNRVKQFVQRGTIHCRLCGLGKDEVDQYIRHRLQHAGRSNGPGIFDHEAIESIYLYSRGIPRLANMIAEAALIYGYADELKIIGKSVIEDVVKDRDRDGVLIGGICRGAAPLTPPHVATDPGVTDKDIRRDIEQKIHSLENTIYRINQALNTRNSAVKGRDEVGLELTEILKRLENRQTLLLERIRSLLH